MLVRDVMSREVVAVDADSSLLDAAVKMKLYDVGMLVVVENGLPAGIVTDRDIAIRGVAEAADPTLFAVSRLMTTQLVACPETATVEAAAQLMGERQIRRVLIVDGDGVPVGVLGLADISRRAGDSLLAGSVMEAVTEPTLVEAVRPYREA